MAFQPVGLDYVGTIADVDAVGAAAPPERQIGLPWTTDPASSWLEYRCWIEVDLDAGMALHKPLPQQASRPDTLAATWTNSPTIDTEGGIGVKVAPNRGVTDAVQRMATSTYRFILRGWAFRAGQQIPIPGLRAVGGITPVPDRVQRASNLLVGNISGIPIWFAYWELHYVIPTTPSQAPVTDLVPFNPALHIRPDAQLPESIALPEAPTDQNATQNAAIHTRPGVLKPPFPGPPSAQRR